MKHTLLILILAASATAAIAQTSTSPASSATPAKAQTATAAAKPANATSEAPKQLPDVDADGNPIYYPDAPELLADVHCGEVSKTCTVKLPKDIPPADAKLVDDFSLRYQDIKIGDGDVALPGKKYTIQYTGWNAASGSKFDSTYEHHAILRDKDGKPILGADGKYEKDTAPDPFSFKWDDHKVIPGLEQGILGMRVGGKRRILIPYQLAYGVYGRRGPNAAHPGVSPKSDIVFDVELLKVEDQYAKPKPEPKAAEKEPETAPATAKTPATK